MTLIIWQDSFSVKVTQIDNQHKQLIHMINELNDAMTQRKANEALGKIIDGLIKYTATHFKTEEQYFGQYGYPQTVSHKKEHADFVAKVTDFKKDFDAGKLMLSIEVIAFLKDWLVNHIQDSDQQYSSFFNEKGLH